MKCSEAKSLGLTRYITGKPCRKGHFAERYTSTSGCVICVKIKSEQARKANPQKALDSFRKWLKNNREIHNFRVKRWRAANKDKFKTTADLWVKANPEKVKAKIQRWIQKNPAAYTAIAVASVARRAKRVPGWLTSDDKWMIQEAYSLARLRTKITGFKWEVDHIIPLRGELVSGLHVPTNLQVIPKSENRLKKNHYLP
jgi:hypothetical protein